MYGTGTITILCNGLEGFSIFPQVSRLPETRDACSRVLLFMASCRAEGLLVSGFGHLGEDFWIVSWQGWDNWSLGITADLRCASNVSGGARRLHRGLVLALFTSLKLTDSRV